MKNRNYVGFWVLVLAFWVLINNVPYSIFHLQSSVAAVNRKKLLTGLSAMIDPNSSLKNKLMRIELNMPDCEKDKIAKSELRSMIQQIRSIEIQMPDVKYEPVIVPEVIPIDEPDEVVVEDTGVQQKKVNEPNVPVGVTAENTVKILKNIPDSPSGVSDPFALGEALFLSGYLKEAAVFYQKALKRKAQDDAGSNRDRAWILFQIGNCLRNENRSEAAKMYLQLITEYPNSPWIPLAQARKTLLDWYLKEKPHKLIEERKKIIVH